MDVNTTRLGQLVSYVITQHLLTSHDTFSASVRLQSHHVSQQDLEHSFEQPHSATTGITIMGTHHNGVHTATRRRLVTRMQSVRSVPD